MRRRIITVALLILTVPFVLVACGGNGEENTSPSPSPSPSGSDLLTTAYAAGDFTTLLAAVQAGGLEATLKGEGPFTLFAPDNAAFAKLRLGAVDELLADPQVALAAVLEYHVVPGKLMSSDLTDGMKLETVNGQLLKVSVSDEGVVRVNAAKVKAPDIEASNGVIHVINRVLLPKELPTPSPTP